MNKIQKEKAEQLLYKKIINENPTLKKFLDESIKISTSEKDKDLVQIIQPIVEDMLNKARFQGINIGFMGAYMGMYEKIKKYNTLEDMTKDVKNETNRIRNKMGLKTVE